jgi:nicotinamide riboside kinase
VIAVLGAESTGKTTLATALAAALVDAGRDAVAVGEYLREFCENERRTPRRDEQAGIAAEQQRRIEAAAAAHRIVVADTTALMIAVYSEQVFGDTSLYAMAEAQQRAFRATLVTALDLPWQADGLQRDGPHVREPVDAKLRAALRRGGIDHAVIAGHGGARLQAALNAAQRALEPPRVDPSAPRWRWICERCGDADCERHLLPRD